MTHFIRFRYPAKHPEIGKIIRDGYLKAIYSSNGKVLNESYETNSIEYHFCEIVFDCDTKPEWLP